MTPESKSTDTTPLNQADHVPSDENAEEAIGLAALTLAIDAWGERWVENEADNLLSVCRAAASALTPSAAVAPAGWKLIEETGASVAAAVVRRICEFDDRTSPEDQPDMMLVTGDELTEIIEEELARYWPEDPTPTEAPQSETTRPVEDEDAAADERMTWAFAMCARLKKAEQERDEARAALTARPVGEDALREALEFYADPDTYVAIGFFPDRPCGEFMEDFSDEHDPGYPKPGKRARAALATPTQPAAGQGAGLDAEGECLRIQDEAQDAVDRFNAKGMRGEALTSQGIAVGASRCARAIAALTPSASKAAPLSDKGDGWLPIETVPLHQDVILGAWTNGEWGALAYNLGGEHWREQFEDEPTHWRPLPASPTPADDTAREGKSDGH